MVIRSKAFQVALEERLNRLRIDPRFKGLGVVEPKNTTTNINTLVNQEN